MTQIQEGVDTLKTRLQSIELPNPEMPKIKLPEIKKRERSNDDAGDKQIILPKVNIPEIKLPNIERPKIKDQVVTAFSSLKGIPKEIETGRLHLRPWGESDAEELFNLAADPDVSVIAGWKMQESLEDSKKIIREELSKSGTYAIVLKDNRSLIGSIGIKRPSESETVRSNKESEIGCWLGKGYWDSDFMQEALNAVISACFGQMHLKGLWYSYYEGEEGSRKVAEQCGFKYHHTIVDMPVPQLDEQKTTHFMLLEKMKM